MHHKKALSHMKKAMEHMKAHEHDGKHHKKEHITKHDKEVDRKNLSKARHAR